MITNIDALKKACALRTLVVEIPGTGETVTMRELSVKDRADHIRMAKENPDDYMHMAAFLAARSCDGLTDNDIPSLMELGADHVQFLSTQALKLSGLLKDAVEEEVKN